MSETIFIELSREDADELAGTCEDIPSGAVKLNPDHPLWSKVATTIRQALKTPCAVVEGEVIDGFDDRLLSMAMTTPLPADTPTGPCKVIVIPEGERA